MKSNIKCQAERCMHNADGLCNAALVHVRNGKNTDDIARCTTYAYRVSNSGSRLLMEMGEDMSLDRRNDHEDIPVSCGKFDCKHNQNCVCGADCICISSPEHDNQCCCESYSRK